VPGVAGLHFCRGFPRGRFGEYPRSDRPLPRTVMLNRKPRKALPGFTWLELLVVILVIGILATIFLINQQNCIGRRMKEYRLAQFQQDFLQKNGHFASSFAELKANLSSEASSKYPIETRDNKSFVFGKTRVVGVFANPDEKNTSTIIVCRAKETETSSIAPPIDAHTCGAGTIEEKCY
jgi:prepilin-type N-terminal cleavage/methylation domain-containing protein